MYEIISAEYHPYNLDVSHYIKMRTETEDEGEKSDESGVAPVPQWKKRQAPLVAQAAPGVRKVESLKKGIAIASGTASILQFLKRN